MRLGEGGKQCPLPVIEAKKALEASAPGEKVEVVVDNEIAVQNLTKMANQKGYGVRSQKLGEDQYEVIMTISVDGEAPQATEEAEEKTVCFPDARKKNTVVVLSSSTMGNGDDELGAILMKGFIYALSQQEELPTTILMYNGGAKISCEESPSLEDLKSLEAQGVEILTCGTCLNHYGLTDKLKVGEVTNMYVIAEKMTQADLIVKP